MADVTNMSTKDLEAVREKLNRELEEKRVEFRQIKAELKMRDARDKLAEAVAGLPEDIKARLLGASGINSAEKMGRIGG